jgi:hypothetical protein
MKYAADRAWCHVNADALIFNREREGAFYYSIWIQQDFYCHALLCIIKLFSNNVKAYAMKL